MLAWPEVAVRVTKNCMASMAAWPSGSEVDADLILSTRTAFGGGPNGQLSYHPGPYPGLGVGLPQYLPHL